MGTFDTALLEALLSVGISPERARAVVESFDRSIDGRCALHAQVLATKKDLAELEPRLVREVSGCRERIATTDARIAESHATLLVRIAGVDARITGSHATLLGRLAETKTELLKWMLGALTAQTALLGALKLF